ncbi:MAG: TRAM domain-containing protein [Candidatus Micrarchaeia archaeon]|jgi:23S rRNA (uridine2552-2'-O)-methyltransferase
MREFEESNSDSSDSKYSDEKPVKVGEEYDVTIESVGSRGDGICKIQNLVIFVAGASQGETLKIRIKDVRPRFAVGERA